MLLGGEVVRAVSGVERFFLAAERFDATAPYINAIAEGRGELSLEAVQTAVRAAAAAHPGMMLRLRGALGRACWETVDDAPQVSLVDGSPWDGLSPAGAPFLDRPLDVHSGATCEALLVPGPVTRLVLRLHHAVTDGTGTMLFLLDIFRALRGEPLAGSLAGPLTAESVVRELRARPEPLSKMLFASVTGAPEKTVAGRTWRRVTVAKHGSGLLPRLVEGLIRSAGAHGEGPWRVNVTVDLRRHCPGVRCSANLSGGLMLDGGPGDFSVDAVADHIGSLLDEKREARQIASFEPLRWLPLGLLARVLRNNERMMLERGAYSASAVVSNLGRQSLRSIDAPGWEPSGLFVAPPGTLGLPWFLAAVGHENGLELCATAPNALATGGRLDQTLDDIRQRLESDG